MSEEFEFEEDHPFVSKFEDFFKTVYLNEINQLAGTYPDKRSLNVDYKRLWNYDYNLAEEILDRPDELLSAAKTAIKNVEVPTLEIDVFDPHIRIYNLPKDKEPLLRDIGAEHLEKLVSIEGIIRQLTDVLPKLEIGTWKCLKCENTYTIKQEGQTVRSPNICECKSKEFKLLADKSKFVDYQKVQIQEPLEKLRGNDQPTVLDVYISDDLVNKLGAGDKTRFTGALRLQSPKDKKLVHGRYLEAIHLEETEKEFAEVEISKEEEEEIKKLSKDPKIYEKLIRSIAPSIYGHETIKEAIILQLFGGVKKALPNSSKLRGNIHVLIVGDPGLAKSQLLRAVDLIAPKSIYVAGKTSSGVGLCVGPNSLVLNSNGFKTVKTFVEERFENSKAKEEITGAWSNDWNEQTFSLDNKIKISKSKIEKIWKIKAPKKMINIKSRLGKELEITPNTPLVCLKNGILAWVKSSELKKGDLVAVARKIPEGKKTKIPFIYNLSENENIRVSDNISDLIKEICEKLLPKYGTLQNIAKKIGVSKDTIYTIRNKKHYHGIKLKSALILAKKAKLEQKLVSKVSKVFVRYGKEISIPKYLDNEELAYLAGIIIGDGDILLTKDRSYVRLSGNSKELHEMFRKTIQKYFKVEIDYIDNKKRVPSSKVKYSVIYSFVKVFGANKDKSKVNIPHEISEMPNKILRNLIQGIMDTNGYVSETKGKGSSHIGISSISEELIKKLQLCLLKFGIISKIRKRKRAGKISFTGNKKVISRKAQWTLEIRGKNNLSTFKKKINFKLNSKKLLLKKIIKKIKKSNPNIDLVPFKNKMISRKRANEFSKLKNDKNLAIIANSDIIWEEISEINSFKPNYEFVYDYTVKDTHNFIANGFITHNTASAVKDDFGEGGWTLKAGALVLASGGIAMIDEFDKMDSEDRSAMHEAMEQQSVSIAKAGIVSTFKTDTSILAAANPKYSRFDPYQNYLEQIDLPSTLISRFDLFFALKDVLDKTKDEEISNHILKTHRAGEIFLQEKVTGKNLSENEEDLRKNISPIIDCELLKKYIAYARQKIFPILEKESIKAISDFYVSLRDMGRKEGSYSATHRQLEGIVRLSEASARIRLKNKIELEDVQRAINLVKSSLQDVVTDPETGKIDIDIITSKQSHSKLSNMMKVLKIIKELGAAEEMVEYDKIIDACTQDGLSEEKTKQFVSELKKKGDIYEPRHNFIKTTSKK